MSTIGRKFDFLLQDSYPSEKGAHFIVSWSFSFYCWLQCWTICSSRWIIQQHTVHWRHFKHPRTWIPRPQEHFGYQKSSFCCHVPVSNKRKVDESNWDTRYRAGSVSGTAPLHKHGAIEYSIPGGTLPSIVNPLDVPMSVWDPSHPGRKKVLQWTPTQRRP